MINKLKKFSISQLILLSAGFFIAIFLITSIFNTSKYYYYTFTGKMQSYELSMQDFELISIKQREDGVYVSTDTDPQFIIQDNIVISGIDMYVDYSMSPGEILCYYAKKENQGFSNRYREWFMLKEDNCYSLDLSSVKTTQLRIDPTMVGGNEIRLEKIVINPEKNLFDFFKVTAGDIYRLTLYSLVLSCILAFIQDLLKRYTK